VARPSLEGADELRRRLEAIGSPASRKDMMVVVAKIVEQRAKTRVPMRSRNLMRSIEAGRVTADSADIHARASYAAYVEFGTGIYGPKQRRITPRRAKVLRWPKKGAARLSGSARRGAGSGDFWHARSVKGSRPQPFMRPAIRDVKAAAGFKVQIADRWNKAA
jgi:HK97 gp10 family phage protein